VVEDELVNTIGLQDVHKAVNVPIVCVEELANLIVFPEAMVRLVNVLLLFTSQE
jgi:hypothetical protein